MKNKFSQWFHSLQTRSSLMLLITAAVLIEVTGLVQYFFARDGIREEVQQRARTELQVRNLQIQNIAGSVETAIDNMQWIIDWSVYNPDSIYSTLKLIIKNNPIITGCAMAFEPDYFPEQGRWYEPFAGRSDGLSGDIVYRQIGSADHDYLNATWYREALKAEGGMWTEPYIDEAGSKMMVSPTPCPSTTTRDVWWECSAAMCRSSGSSTSSATTTACTPSWHRAPDVCWHAPTRTW